MEKRFKESDRSERRRSPQNEPPRSRGPPQQEPAPRSSMNDASGGRMRMDRNTRQYIQVHPKKGEDRQRQSEEVHIRSDDAEVQRRRLSSSPSDLRQQRGQRQRHAGADRPRQTIPPPCSTKADPKAFLPPKRPKSIDSNQRKEPVSSPPSRRYIIQTQRNPERVEGYRPPGRPHVRPSSPSARTSRDELHASNRGNDKEQPARVLQPQPRPHSSNPDLDRRHRDPRLARMRPRKNDGSLARQEGHAFASLGDEPPVIRGKSSPRPPAGKNDGQREEPRPPPTKKGRPGSPQHYAPPGGQLRRVHVELAEAPVLPVELPRARSAAAEEAVDSPPRVTSASAPIDPRRQLGRRPSPSASITKTTVSDASPAVNSTFCLKRDESQSFGRIDVDLSSERAPNTPGAEINPLKKSPLREYVHLAGDDGDRPVVKEELTIWTQEEVRKPPIPESVSRPQDTQERRGGVHSHPRGGKNFGPKYGQDEAEHAKAGGNASVSREDEIKGMDRCLSLSIEGVTLGGTDPKSHCETMRGVHVRLPLKHAPPTAAAHGLPPKGPPTFSVHHEPRRPEPLTCLDPPMHQPGRPSFFREPPLMHREAPTVHRELPPDHREPPPIHRERPPLHREPPPIHRMPPPGHRDPPPIHHKPPPVHAPPVNREPPHGHGIPPPIHRDPLSLRNEQRQEGAPGTRNVPPEFGSITPSPRPRLEQRPWLNNEGSGIVERFDRSGDFPCQHPQTDQPRVRMVTLPAAAGSLFPGGGGGERRSAYAQAMHNKRFMGYSDTEGQQIRPVHPEGVRGPGMPVNGTDSTPVAFGPPNRQMHPPQQFAPRFPSEPRFYQPPPLAGQWGNISGGRGKDFGQGAPIEMYAGQCWDPFSDDEDDGEFPLEHTSPEWTPASASSKNKGSEPDAASAKPPSDNVGSSDTVVSTAGPGESIGKHDEGEVAKEEAAESKESEVPQKESQTAREMVDVSRDDVPCPPPKLVGTGGITTDVRNGAQPTGEPEVKDSSSKETIRKQRLQPTPLAQVSWGVGDLAKRFPRLAIPDNLTHVIASWTALDTRAIGVISMICQHLVRTKVDESGAGGEVEMRKSKGKRKRIFYDESVGGDEEIAGEPSRRAWNSRVLVPFGLIPERAADDCWAEALRLVLASSNTGASPEDRNGSRAAAGDDETIVEGRASGRKRLTLPGGLWDEELDGGDPEVDDNRALIRTAIRACKTSGGVDLTYCCRWLKFCELHEDDRVTVIFLCGGGVRAAEGASEDLCVATISDLINGGVSSVEEGVVESHHAQDVTFETQLAAEFLWGLVCRDWAAVMLDCLRLHAEPLSNEARRSKGPRRDTPVTADLTVRESESPQKGCPKHDGDGLIEMLETPAEVRAAFRLFDIEGEGWVSSDRLEAWLLDAGLRLSVRYLKSLLRSLCRVTEDGKRFLFEYRRRLATWGREAVSGGSEPQPKSTESESGKVTAGNGSVLPVDDSGKTSETTTAA